jgi:hypothetical protein
MKQLLAWVVLLLSIGQAASAQEIALPAPEVLDRMCSAKGAMQYGFGDTGVPGSSKLESMMRTGMTLPAAAQPFEKAQPRSTEWSGRFMEMTYSVAMPKEQAAQATVLIASLGKALAAAGWSKLDMPIDKAPLYLTAYASDQSYAKPADGPRGATRVLAAISYELGEVSFTCGRDDLLRDHAQEAFGKLPLGTPRPVVPPINAPNVTVEADCLRPEKIAEVQAVFASGKADRFMGDMLARTTYRDRLTQWMLWRLESSGKISPQRLISLSLTAVGKSSPGGNPLAAMEMLGEMMPVLDLMAKAENTHDADAMCRSLIPLHKLMARADAITLEQTEATQAALVAEAKRLGVSLD